MKFPPLYTLLVCAALMATPSHLTGQPAASATTGAVGPRLTFVTNEYHFGQIMGGEKVDHTFVFTNTGDQTLVISQVTPGCHCTTVGDWTKAHQIEPGMRGEIPIRFDSGVFQGSLHRNITVTSNDKLAPRQTLILSGTIVKAFDVLPPTVNIRIIPDAAANPTAVVHIKSHADEPVTLSNPTSDTGKFEADVKTVIPGKEFEVTITALPPFTPGNSVGTISLNTSMTKVPVIHITAVANMPPPVVVSPMQIVLSPQVVRSTTNIVNITSNWGKPLALSDLEISDTRVSVQLKETVPGRQFQLAAVFPPGYQVPPGPQVRLSVKSNNPDSPVINVPVIQFVPRQPMSPPLARPRVVSQNPPVPPATGHP